MAQSVDPRIPARLRAIRPQQEENASFWLILSEADDGCAVWLTEEMRKRTRQPVMHLTTHDLAQTARAERGIDADGPWFSMTTLEGRTVHSRRLLGVVNRLVPASHPCGGRPQAMIGSAAETPESRMQPLLRWLESWTGPVINRPMGFGPGTTLLPAAWWMEQAIAVGFLGADDGGRAGAGADEPRTRVAVVGDGVCSMATPGAAVPEALEWRCLRLARSASATVLGVSASRAADGNWRFLEADLCPDLRLCGEAAAELLVKSLLRQATANGDAVEGAEAGPG